jgi:hypothetical protein
MSKDKKKPRNQPQHERQEIAWPPLSDLEEEISLICLRFFRGDWDMYLDYLSGPRVGEAQRGRELPVVERLRTRDAQTDYLTALLEDEVVAAAERMDFEHLLRLWELCLLLEPQEDPFFRSERQSAEQGASLDEPPPSLH